MTAHECRGAFYAYAPKPIQKSLFGPGMGLSEDHLECGGSLQRLQRNLPCDQEALSESRYGDIKSFYMAMNPRLKALAQEAGTQTPGESYDHLVRSFALQRIRQAPLAHLSVSVPLAWRRMWSFKDKDTWHGAILNGLAMISLLLMPWVGLALRKPDWILISMLGSGYFFFYALFSPFIPRCSEPLIPVSLVCLSLLVLAVARQGYRKICCFREPSIPARIETSPDALLASKHPEG